MAQLDKAAKELEQLVDATEKRIDRLKSLYEQYFQGIERIQPSMERTALKIVLMDLRKTKIRNTALKFRIHQLVARMNTYENYWSRIARQIEEGTYHRDVFKARYRSKLKEEAQATQPAAETKPVPGRDSKVPAAGKRPAAATGLSDDKVKAIHDAYLLAKRRCKETTKGLTQDAIASSLRKQVPAIIKQYKCKTVEFKVVIKKGKAILKAVPKF